MYSFISLLLFKIYPTKKKKKTEIINNLNWEHPTLSGAEVPGHKMQRGKVWIWGCNFQLAVTIPNPGDFSAQDFTTNPNSV